MARDLGPLGVRRGQAAGEPAVLLHLGRQIRIGGDLGLEGRQLLADEFAVHIGQQAFVAGHRAAFGNRTVKETLRKFRAILLRDADREHECDAIRPAITSQVMEAFHRHAYTPPMANSHTPVGDHLREWRQRRRMSQLDLALEAEISTRHLSFLETGRAQPSRDMVMLLAEQLEVPLRERNVILVAAGFAPVFPERPLDDPALGAARKAVDLILAAHEPYPALLVDLRWNMVAANAALGPLLAGVAPELLEGTVNVLRLALHPKGVAPRILNLAEWRAHILESLRRHVELTADPGLIDLVAELHGYPAPPASDRRPDDLGGVAVPLQLMTGTGGVLSFISTTTVFGTAVDITLAELTLETFFPADAATAEALRGV